MDQQSRIEAHVQWRFLEGGQSAQISHLRRFFEIADEKLKEWEKAYLGGMYSELRVKLNRIYITVFIDSQYDVDQNARLTAYKDLRAFAKEAVEHMIEELVIRPHELLNL